MRTAPDSQCTMTLLRPREKQKLGYKHVDGVSQRGQILTTRVGLVLPDDLTYESWKQAGPKLFRIASSSSWCLGDWLIYGQQKYAGRYRSAIEDAGLDYQTLRNYAWIARKFEVSRRRDALSFQHHAEVASLPTEEQEQWLDLAQTCGWSRSQLRTNIRARNDKGKMTLNTMFIPRVPVAQEDLTSWRKAAANSCSTFENWVVSALNKAAADSLGIAHNNAARDSELVSP